MLVGSGDLSELAIPVTSLKWLPSLLTQLSTDPSYRSSWRSMKAGSDLQQSVLSALTKCVLLHRLDKVVRAVFACEWRAYTAAE